MPTVNMRQTSYLLQSPAYCFTDSKDHYILLILCYPFCVHRLFDVAELIFQKLSTQCCMFWIDYVIWGVHTCPLKLRAKIQFSPICGLNRQFGAWGGADKHSNWYNFSCMTPVTRCLLPGWVFQVNLSNEDTAMVGNAPRPRGRLSSWVLATS